MSLDSPSDSAVTTLYRAALGPVNTERYVQAFARLDAMGRTLTSWHWAACFFTLGWMVYRQLWGAALVYVAAAEGVALLVFGLGRPLLQWPQAVEWGVVGAFAILGSVVPGLYAHAILHADIRKRVTKALAASANIPEACDLLAKQAVSRKRLTWVIAGHALLAGVALLAYLVFPQGTFTGEAQAQAAAPSASWNTPSPTLTPASRPVAEKADRAAAQPKPQPSSAPTVAGDAEDARPAATVAAAPPQALAVKPAAAPADKAPADGANGTNRAKGASQATPSVSDKAPEKTPAKPADKPAEKSAEKPAAKASGKASEKPPEKPADKAKEAPAPKASAQQAAASKAVAAKASEPTRAKPVPAGKTPAASSAARQAEGKASAASGITVGTAPGFYINVGLFADESNARKAQSRLLNEGLPAFRQTLDSAKGTRTRVRVGPFASRSEAESAASSIRALELDAVIFQK